MRRNSGRSAQVRQRADRLTLLLLWADANVEIRQAFQGSFVRFERYADLEAERLICSAVTGEETAERLVRRTAEK